MNKIKFLCVFEKRKNKLDLKFDGRVFAFKASIGKFSRASI